MKHKARDWISDRCLCGETFTDRLVFGQHALTCQVQVALRVAKGEVPLTPEAFKFVQTITREMTGDNKK